MEQIVSAVMDVFTGRDWSGGGLRGMCICHRPMWRCCSGPAPGREPKRPLSQPGQFLSEQRVTLVGPKGRKERVAVLGRACKATQVELSKSDCMELGVKAPVRESGDVAGSGAITIEGPCGTLELRRAIDRPQPHPRHRAGLQAAGSERQAAGVRGRDEASCGDFPGCHHPGEHGI